MAHVRQPRPDSGVGFEVKDLIFFRVAPRRSVSSEYGTCKAVEARLWHWLSDKSPYFFQGCPSSLGGPTGNERMFRSIPIKSLDTLKIKCVCYDFMGQRAFFADIRTGNGARQEA